MGWGFSTIILDDSESIDCPWRGLLDWPISRNVFGLGLKDDVALELLCRTPTLLHPCTLPPHPPLPHPNNEIYTISYKSYRRNGANGLSTYNIKNVLLDRKQQYR